MLIQTTKRNPIPTRIHHHFNFWKYLITCFLFSHTWIIRRMAKIRAEMIWGGESVFLKGGKNFQIPADIVESPKITNRMLIVRLIFMNLLDILSSERQYSIA
jgi:hypothetical protein